MLTGPQAARIHWGPCRPASLLNTRFHGLGGAENRTVAEGTSPEEGATALVSRETQASGPLECGWPPRVPRISIWVRSPCSSEPHLYTRRLCQSYQQSLKVTRGTLA